MVKRSGSVLRLFEPIIARVDEHKPREAVKVDLITMLATSEGYLMCRACIPWTYGMYQLPRWYSMYDILVRVMCSFKKIIIIYFWNLSFNIFRPSRTSGNWNHSLYLKVKFQVKFDKGTWKIEHGSCTCWAWFIKTTITMPTGRILCFFRRSFVLVLDKKLQEGRFQPGNLNGIQMSTELRGHVERRELFSRRCVWFVHHPACAELQCNIGPGWQSEGGKHTSWKGAYIIMAGFPQLHCVLGIS